MDVCDPRLLAVEALLEVKKRVAPYLDLQLVAFPQDGVLRSPGAMQNLERSLDMGVEVVGGIPHFERTMADGAESVRLLCELAAKRGLRVDMHCDETDDPMSRHIETLAFHTQRLGLHGRVNGSHLTSMHSMDNYYVSKLLPLIAEAQVSAVANPLINITIQGRHDTYPKRRGMTRVPELLAAGVPVAFGHDCVMDPWYSLGSADMLEVAHMGLHVAQMTGQEAMRACFRAVTETPAKILGLEGYGIAARLQRGSRVTAGARSGGGDPASRAASGCLASRSGHRSQSGATGDAQSARPTRNDELSALTRGNTERGISLLSPFAPVQCPTSPYDSHVRQSEQEGTEATEV